MNNSGTGKALYTMGMILTVLEAIGSLVIAIILADEIDGGFFYGLGIGLFVCATTLVLAAIGKMLISVENIERHLGAIPDEEEKQLPSL